MHILVQRKEGIGGVLSQSRVRLKKQMKMVDVRDMRIVRHFSSISNISWIRRDVVWIVGCLRRNNDSRLFGFESSDSVLDISAGSNELGALRNLGSPNLLYVYIVVPLLHIQCPSARASEREMYTHESHVAS